MINKLYYNYKIGRQFILISFTFLALGILFGSSTNAATIVKNYNYTGNVQSELFSPGTYQLEVWGAQGQGGTGTSGGLGGYAKGSLTIVSPTILNIYVGGQSGWNGGGVAGETDGSYVTGSGGGASDIRVSGTAFSDRVIVAGGGGGGGDNYYTTCNGGAGGGTAGGTGDLDGDNPGGAGGTQSSGYALGQGGLDGSYVGGGGGGGYYGGFSGYGPDLDNSRPGGGGGSGYIGGVTGGTMSNGIRYGNGLVRITFTDITPPTVSLPTSNNITTTSFTVTANASDISTPLQYLFNINGSDVGTWQSSSIYTFTGLNANMTYIIKYKAQDSGGNISAYSSAINVTTAAILGVVSPPAISEVRDLYNNNDASDIRIIFKGASNESKIASYKVIVALAGGAQPTDSVGASLTTLATNSVTGNYVSEPKKGNGRLHLFMLPSKLQTYDNKPISGALKIYVLSVATIGNSDKLSSGVDITFSTNNSGFKVEAPTPTVVDISNAGNGSDMRVSFAKPKSEMNISSYAVIVQKVSAGDLTSGGETAIITANNYTSVAVNSVVRTYIKTMIGAKDSSGAALVNDVSYKVYILVIGKNGYANVLSSASRPITLLATVPATLPVRNLTAVKTGSGHTGSNISVTFSEPLAVSNVQEYRVFISTGTGSLDSVTAAGLNNTRYIKVDSTARGAAHTVTLTGLNNIYDGTALGVGDYKVYVFTVGKTSTYASRLTGPSRLVKLD